jgi:hypothetical protein
MGHRRTPRADLPSHAQGRTITGNVVYDRVMRFIPDAFARQAASLGLMTSTISPGSAGRHSPGASAIGFVGDRGYGVNRWAGRTPYQQGAVQSLGSPITPVGDPRSRRLGIGAMPAGQPGYPSTGQDAGGLSSLAYLGYAGINNRTGLGG